MPQEIHPVYGGFRNWSLSTEATFGTAAGGSYVSVPVPISSMPRRTTLSEEDFLDVKTGKRGQDLHELTRYDLNWTDTGEITPQIAMLFLSMLYGTGEIATTSPGGLTYVHTGEVDESTMLKVSRTLEDDDGNEGFTFPGATCTAFTLSIDRAEPFAQFEAEFIGQGTQTVGAVTEAAGSGQSFFRLIDAQIELGGSYSAGVYDDTLAVNRSAPTKTLSIPLNDGRGGGLVDDDFEVGGPDDGGVAIVSCFRNGRFEYGPIEWTIEVDAGFAHRTAYQNGSELTFYMALTGDAIDVNGDYKIEFIFPRTKITNVEVTEEDGINVANLTLKVLQDDTEAPFIFRVTDDVADYTLTA